MPSGRIDHGALGQILEDLVAQAEAEADWGRTAQHIPSLANVDPERIGVAVALADGHVACAGAAEVPFSIQSISKAFALGVVLGRFGDDIWTRVGREAAGTAFDSITLLERERGRPRNPFINAGALVVTDAMIRDRSMDATLTELLTFVRGAAENEAVSIDRDVALSEADRGHRNASLAHYLASCNNLENPADTVLDVYFRQCAVEMTCVCLARAGRMFAGLPSAPRILSRRRIRGINALMLTCGHYDGSGEFAYRVGLPGKSGVGGGILVIVPGIASIGIWSPGLDRFGNSLAGTRLAERLAKATDWSIV